MTSDPATTVIEIRPRRGLERLGLPQLWEHRHLVRFFVLRSLRARYRPAFFGRAWVVLEPALFAGVYWLVFGRLLGVQSPGVPFPLFVFAGIGLFLFFSGATSACASSLADSSHLFAKVYYPRLVAPVTAVAARAVDLGGVLAVILAMMAGYRILPGPEALLAPLFLGGLVLLAFGLGLVLAAASVRRRDVQIALPVTLRLLLYASPATYPVELVPAEWRGLYFANPLAVMMQGFRWSLMGGPAPPAWSVGAATAAVLLVVLAGLYAFHRVEGLLVDSL